MASTSASRTSGVAERIRNSASTIYSENQSLITEIRKSMTLMKEIAVDLEKNNESHMVKQLEDAVIKSLDTFESCTHFSSVIQSVGDSYQPKEELTDFKKLFEDEILKLKDSSSSDREKHPLIRQFREAIWNVHHAGQPIPGEEQEDIVMTSTQCNILNNKCPLSGKPVTELARPVRSVDCKHIYEKEAVMQYIRSKQTRGQCPVAGCPKILQAGKVVCDPLLLIEIDELRTMSKETATGGVIEDFTMLDEEESER
ncbi:E3 SUMO-protein ligase MMS21 [Quillaja saponaria]|uniref:E3 SUMO-protein ligase MMS21 n=1 Tax=Quillaja saponaria TaxID=32244 RepID=A0AAD7KZH3_QUISA|nr:E3 SUMO-protein ligase MMS21 [Quillaja saponaria]